MKHCNDFTVLENEAVNSSFFKLRLKSEQPLCEIRAGQFVELKVQEPNSVLLRRPISIHDIDKSNNEMVLLIQKAGKGTNILSTLKKGERVNMIYPLGNGFECKGKSVLLVGGGVGTAPLLFLAKQFAQININPKVLLGFRSKDQLMDTTEFEKYAEVFISTQDGSVGEQGLVTENSVFARSFDAVYTCGPTPMMKAVAKSCEERNIDCFVSLENKMACGIGACLCCVQQTTSGHRCTCTEGPVFQSKEIVW